jgi:hypothetical protein
MERAMDLIGIRQAGVDVDVPCYEYNRSGILANTKVGCTDDGAEPTSIMWSLPFGQSFNISVPLDFDLDAGSFPLEISFSGADGSVPLLRVGWCFNLAFGFDEVSGFFLYTFPGKNAEISVEGLLEVLDRRIDATLFFLKAVLDNIDLEIGAGLFVDIDKASALRISSENETDRDYGRLTRTNLRQIVKKSELFLITATAGATLKIPDITFEVNGDLLGSSDVVQEILNWIPRLEAQVYAQGRKEFTAAKSTKRRLDVLESNRRRLGQSSAMADHPSVGLLRSLSISGDESLLSKNFDFDLCPVNTTSGEIFCARVVNLTLDMSKIRDLVAPILEEFTNTKDDGYLDKLVSPLLVLDEALPGVSDVLGKDTTVLDIAEASNDWRNCFGFGEAILL